MMKLITKILMVIILMTGTAQAKDKQDTAIFAGGCFWCMQPVFDSATGVTKTTVGYSGGTYVNPTYEDLHNRDTGHYEAIEVVYDPVKASYEELVRIYFGSIDPFDAEGQFADKGHEYKTVIFYNSAEQQKTAEKVKAEVQLKFPGKMIAVQILPAQKFYSAEEYHQDYYKKNPVRYEGYKYGSGRADGLKRIWKSK